MLYGKKIVVVMPAYNAARTLERTHAEVLATGVVDEIIVVDDASRDETVKVARKLIATSGEAVQGGGGPVKTQLHVHEHNLGYGGNQKTCYNAALESGGDVIVMVHPDYQYTPKLIPAMASLIASGLYSCVLGSRILGGGAMKSGMPWWKYVSNRFLTFAENLLLGAKLSEYHTGYRAFSRELIEQLPLEQNSNDFIFDNQMLAQIIWLNYTVAEITCPTKYFEEASSINFVRSLKYGFGCLGIGLRFRLARMGLAKRLV